MKVILAFLLFYLSSFSFASEVYYLARSPQALLMGDAYTAIADDEYTLFYNPAALGGSKGVSLTGFNPTLGLPNIISDLNKFSNMPTGSNAAPAIAQRFMEFPIFFQTSAIPTVKIGQFGMSLFLNNKTNMVLRNATHPILDLNYNYDRGFIAGYAFEIGTGAKKSKPKRGAKADTSAGERLSFGVSVKHLNREGMQGQYDLFGTKLLSTITGGGTSISSLKNALGFSSGSGWGFDMGAEYAVSSGHSTLTAGYSILDIGNTHFNNQTKGVTAVPIQKMTMNSGVAFKQDFGIFDYTLSADMHPMFSQVDFSRQFHFGTEFSIPLITLMAGWSEGYLSYGASVKLWPLKLTTGFYGVEVGSHLQEQQAKRFILYLSLFDFSIDL